MERNIPRAAIHVGTDKKSFSSQVGNEAERRGWDEKRYQLKNADIDKNNHYNYSRKRLNFEILKGGKIVPLGSQSVPLHERLQHRLDELGFKPYMDAKRPDQVSRNSPNSTVGIIFSGDHDVLNRLAFGEQKLNTSDPNADHSNVTLQKGIYDWALDTYRFACEKWGEENVIGFDVHCDEISIHAHVQTVPVEQVKKRGCVGSKYIHKDNPEKVLSTKEWRALPKEELASAKSYNTTLMEMYNDLKVRWNAIWQEPEMTDAWRRVEARKEKETKEKARQEAEAKRESMARQNRYIGVLDKFIREGHKALSSFAKTDRVNFNKKESASIYYGVMASAVKHNIELDSKASIESAAKSFLSGMSWKGFTDFKQECVTSWTKLFATNEVQFTDNAIDNFLAFVDHMSCSADTYVSLGGSNGCADQLTNWDGTQKVGLGIFFKEKKKSQSR